jgi:hypothetical protein
VRKRPGACFGFSPEVALSRASAADRSPQRLPFAILGPPIAAAAFYLILLPLAGLLEGVPVVIDTPVLPVWSSAVFASLVVAVFDWGASLIEVPFRPVAAAIAGWLLAVALLRGYLALPDLPG